MSLATIPGTRPTEAPDVGDDDDVGHWYCCDPDIAMCGAWIGDVEEADDDDEDGPDCPLCAYIDDEGLPCPVPGCPGGER